MKVKAGEQLVLDGSASTDPDGDTLKHHWWIYPEACTYMGKDFEFQKATTATIEIVVPKEAKGKTIHIIYELKDENPMVSLTDYRRVILSVD